jgi:hypothetical protein
VRDNPDRGRVGSRLAHAALPDVRLTLHQEGSMRHEVVSWLRLLGWAVGAVAVAGSLIAIGSPVLELIAMR